MVDTSLFHIVIIIYSHLHASFFIRGTMYYVSVHTKAGNRLIRLLDPEAASGGLFCHHASAMEHRPLPPSRDLMVILCNSGG